MSPLTALSNTGQPPGSDVRVTGDWASRGVRGRWFSFRRDAGILRYTSGPPGVFLPVKRHRGEPGHVSSLRHRGRSSTFSVDGARGESLAPAFRGPRRDSRAFSSHFHNGKRSYASCDCSSNTPSPVQGDEHFFELGGCLCTIQHVPRHPRLFKPS